MLQIDLDVQRYTMQAKTSTGALYGCCLTTELAGVWARAKGNSFMAGMSDDYIGFVL